MPEGVGVGVVGEGAAEAEGSLQHSEEPQGESYQVPIASVRQGVGSWHFLFNLRSGVAD